VVTATYGLYADWNNDGDYGDAGEDISADWMQIAITRGFSAPLARYPTVGRMTVVLKNAAQTYSPPTTAAARPHRPVKLTMTYGGTTKTLFEGHIESIRPTFGTNRERRAVLTAVDRVSDLDRFAGDVALQTGVWADDIIEAVVAVVWTPDTTAYDPGVNQFPTSGDLWNGPLDGLVALERSWRQSSGVRASDKIADACIADWGRFFISGAGTPTFYNRHHVPLDASADFALDNTMTAMQYEMSDTEVYNYIEVTCHPRSVGSVAEVLGRVEQGNPPMIDAGDTSVFDIRFRDPSNNAIHVGGMAVITPVTSTDYEATSDEAGEGSDETANLGITSVPYGDHIEVTLENTAAYPIYVQKLQVRGWAVRTREPITVVAQDATSIAAYGKRKLALDAALMASDVQAQALANYLLGYYKDPLHDVRGVSFFANRDATLMAAARDIELLQQVTLSEDQTGLDAEALFIYAIRHEITPPGVHRVTVDLEQPYAIGGTVAVVDDAHVDGPEVVAY
jgi:hypothetical protein